MASEVERAMKAVIDVLHSEGRAEHARQLLAVLDRWNRVIEKQARESHEMFAVYPIDEMLKRGWLHGETVPEIEASLVKFFGLDSIDEVPGLGPVDDVKASEIYKRLGLGRRYCKLAGEIGGGG